VLQLKREKKTAGHTEAHIGKKKRVHKDSEGKLGVLVDA
jgi:hypothetical protein